MITTIPTKYDIGQKVYLKKTALDIYRHIDIWVGANSFDVKAAKKTNRSDLLPNYDIH